jgi:hypothetical protein
MVKRWEHGNIAIVNHRDYIKKGLLIQQKTIQQGYNYHTNFP